jgi:hypothetical protein
VDEPVIPKEMLELLGRPETALLMGAVQQIAGFQIPDRYRRIFLDFHQYITKPQPKFISEWRADPKREVLYHRLTNGVLGDVQSAFAAVLYHAENLASLERSLMRVIEENDIKSKMNGWSFGGGNSLRFDFEYHAFVMAYRSCLEYMTSALSAYFRERSNSFRKFPSFLEKKRPQSVAQVLIKEHRKHVDSLAFVLSDGDTKSVRDRVAHFEFVGAGCVNVNASGVFLVGGGENLSGLSKSRETLTVALDRKIASLEIAVSGMLSAFQTAAAEEDARLV